MTLAETWLLVRGQWRWLAVVLGLVLVLGGGWAYGHNQYARGASTVRADIADSIGRVYEKHYDAFRDSTNVQIAAFQATLSAATNRAVVAEAQAAAARAAAAAVLTPTIIAKTPPEVLALVMRQNAVIDTLVASNRELVAKIQHSDSLLSSARYAITLADTTIAQKDRTIEELRKKKDPPHGFLHTVAVVAKYTGAVATGIAIGLVIHH